MMTKAVHLGRPWGQYGRKVIVGITPPIITACIRKARDWLLWHCAQPSPLPHPSQYYEVMNRCNWAILPSCSEGAATSVIECMNQGLIPVVTQACGLDIGDYGVLIEPCTIEEIGRVILMLSTYSAARCKEMSLGAHKAAVTDFSEAAFRPNMTDAVQSILRLKTKGNTKCSGVHT